MVFIFYEWLELKTLLYVVDLVGLTKDFATYHNSKSYIVYKLQL